ncbi:MAG: sulfatase-like hydrolase/transferase [Ectothiorhodospiraceae bacterium]|nr:sulfatase-like hydrolase/transferase [Chromatiales bacterium]MCP5156388.1 sulfatase-like hydrolase/transferase [Ectothiorhodospiraceae bacterium]
MPVPTNLIWFQSDNHNRGVLGCYEHPTVRTPNLDALAARGTRFANAYAASALCCPARASLACGRYPHQTGYWDNAIVYDGRFPSWMRRVRDQGHRVDSFGKLHYRSSEDDNGFTTETDPMHILGGKGGVSMLLRGYDDEQVNVGQWELYADRSGVGTTHYQDFDARVADQAIAWLEANARASGKPWVLHVSFPSPHPPFSVPQRLWDLYPLDAVPLPPLYSPDERPDHPALAHLRHIMRWDDISEDMVRRVGAGYFALITHLDEQIGRVMAAAERLGLLDRTRVLYTSDHGEMHGSHGLLGKCSLYEGAIGVPLIIAGPGILEGAVREEICSHVDLFPTVVEAAGARPDAADGSLPGASLWPALEGADRARIGFAEYHAAGSRNASFMLRDGPMKLVYHVGMPAQLFDLESDPNETTDLAGDPAHEATVARLERRLRAVCDPEAVDARAKADQRAKVEFWGGIDAVKAEGMLVFTPPPGAKAEVVA